MLCFWKVLNFGGVVLFCDFMQKVLVFGQMIEFLCTVIKSCWANFGVKGQVFFSISNMVQECQFWAKNKKKKMKSCGEVLTVSSIVHYYWQWLPLWKTCLFLENGTFCLKKVLNSDKKLQFFLGDINLYLC